MATAPCDVLVVLTGPPYASDLVTTVLRMLDELARRMVRVRVWTCGYATMLSLVALGERKPREVDNWARTHPSTAAILVGLLERSGDRLTWEVCTFCAEDRGVAGPHLPPVRLRAPSRLGSNVAAAGTTIYIGGA
jgi:sulfur relay (sulfurtransferase) complex TusBCD TusD component (DsrE family)